MFRSRDDFKPQAISRIIMVCVRAVYERPVKVCGTHVSFRVVYDPPCAQDAVLFAWVYRLSFRVRRDTREFTTLYRQVSHSHVSVQLSADSTQVCRPVRSRHSAVRSPQRWASAVALAGGRCFTRGSIQITVSASLLYAYAMRSGCGTRTHGFLRYGFTLFKHGLRISLHEIHT